MGVTSQILINKPREGVHKAGRPVTGVVKYAIDDPTGYQEVTLSFLGKGKCSWTESYGKTSTTYSGSEDYIIRHANLTNNRPGETITLHGVYEFPFEFYLPQDIPTSHKDTIGSITYIIQLKFVKANFFNNKKVFTAEIPVHGSVAPITTVVDESGCERTYDGPIIFGLEKTPFSLFDNTSVVNLKAEIAKTCFTPGENVHLTYKVTNNTRLTIPSIRTDLYCYTTYTADCGSTNKQHVRVKKCKMELPSVAARAVKNFTCVLPTVPELYSIQHSKVISREYRVYVTVRLPAPHTNATVEVPVVFGQQRDVAEPSFEAYGSIDSQPPSYWEVMSEERANYETTGRE